MEDDKFKIHLRVDNEYYPLVVARKDEGLYREAAKQIDYKLNKYRSMYPEFPPTKHWAMAALELSFENVSMKDRNDTQPYADALKRMKEYMDNCIHTEEEEAKEEGKA